VVRYLRVGGVAFGLCGSRCAVIHAVGLLCAECCGDRCFLGRARAVIVFG
jgi:hypothetical protein